MSLALTRSSRREEAPTKTPCVFPKTRGTWKPSPRGRGWGEGERSVSLANQFCLEIIARHYFRPFHRRCRPAGAGFFFVLGFYIDAAPTALRRAGRAGFISCGSCISRPATWRSFMLLKRFQQFVWAGDARPRLCPLPQERISPLARCSYAVAGLAESRRVYFQRRGEREKPSPRGRGWGEGERSVSLANQFCLGKVVARPRLCPLPQERSSPIARLYFSVAGLAYPDRVARPIPPLIRDSNCRREIIALTLWPFFTDSDVSETNRQTK
jgi:hypothetical protein